MGNELLQPYYSEVLDFSKIKKGVLGIGCIGNRKKRALNLVLLTMTLCIKLCNREGRRKKYSFLHHYSFRLLLTMIATCP